MMMVRYFTATVLLIAVSLVSGFTSPTYASTTNTVVSATSVDGTPTGFVVTRGQTLTFQASGFWCSGGIKNDGSASCGGPEGIRPADPGEEADLVLLNQPVGLLIGRIGSWVFPIGGGTQIRAQESGQLVLLMNDRAPYYADNSGEVTATFALRVPIDIKPGQDFNRINPRSRGTIPVAILSTHAFNATTVNPHSVTFGPNAASPVNRRPSVADINGDGRRDLVFHFAPEQIGITAYTTQACLTGKTTQGFSIQGCDRVRVVP